MAGYVDMDMDMDMREAALTGMDIEMEIRMEVTRVRVRMEWKLGLDSEIMKRLMQKVLTIVPVTVTWRKIEIQIQKKWKWKWNPDAWRMQQMMKWVIKNRIRNSSLESKDAVHEEKEREKIEGKEHGLRLKRKEKKQKRTMKSNRTGCTRALSFTNFDDRLHEQRESKHQFLTRLIPFGFFCFVLFCFEFGMNLWIVNCMQPSSTFHLYSLADVNSFQ
jgi:hypothetical protein